MTNQQLNSSKSSLKKVENDNTNNNATTKTKRTTEWKQIVKGYYEQKKCFSQVGILEDGKLWGTGMDILRSKGS
jgi:hypothetical protein